MVGDDFRWFRLYISNTAVPECNDKIERTSALVCRSRDVLHYVKRMEHLSKPYGFRIKRILNVDVDVATDVNWRIQ
jgi:hypothetical protein